MVMGVPTDDRHGPTPASKESPSSPATAARTREMKELHVAPMLNYSSREFRALFRILSRRAVLWTEMVVDETILHSPHIDEHLHLEAAAMNPVVVQLGGSRPDSMERSAAAAGARGYPEINLNADCPSKRVAGERLFGAALMKDAPRCAEVLRAISAGAPAGATVSVKWWVYGFGTKKHGDGRGHGKPISRARPIHPTQSSSRICFQCRALMFPTFFLPPTYVFRI